MHKSHIPTFKQLMWEDVREGQVLSTISMDVTYKNAILHVGAGWDYMPGHHNPEYARSQGQKTVFLNTLFHQSFIDRIITDWAGPLTFIKRRKIAMKEAIYADEEILGEGEVARVYLSDEGWGLVDLNLRITNERAECCLAESTIQLPRRS